MKSRIYLNTWYLLEAIDTKSRNRSDCRSLLRRLSGKQYDLIISQIVIGEAVAKILTKYNETEAIKKLQELTHMVMVSDLDLKNSLPQPKNNAFECMVELQKLDPIMTHNDIMIVSQALADPYSNHLVFKIR